MKQLLLAAVALLVLCSHDMFLKLDDYHLPARTAASIELVNGTFERSDNVIDRNRMRDVSIVAGGQRMSVDTSQWTERGLSTILNFKTGTAGTYVAGVSTRARDFEMEAEAFNNYLEHDGVVDELQWRKDNNALGQTAFERYSKHVKTIFQVGEERSDDWSTELGYPIEFIPLSNPYDLAPGGKLSVRLLRGGQPLGYQTVLFGHEHEHGGEQHDHDHDHQHGGEGHHHSSQAQRTDELGVVTIPITEPGTYHLRTIHMERKDGPKLTHESNWATLTFGVAASPTYGHSHGHARDHDHDHEHGPHTHTHDQEGGLPGWAWIALSLGIIAGLFFYFKGSTGEA